MFHQYELYEYISLTLSRTLIQEIFKRFVGEYRPYFLGGSHDKSCELLDGSLAKYIAAGNASAHSPIWVKVDEVCKKPLHIDGLQSFPSGHTGSAFAAGVYMALYLNAKLKAFSNYHTSFWKHICVLAPVLGAALIGCAMILDCVS